jgi:hypothetical protein
MSSISETARKVYKERPSQNGKPSSPISARVLQRARTYVKAGISVLPVKRDGSKRPDPTDLPRIRNANGDMEQASWKPLQERLPTDEELQIWFGGSKPAGIGVISGQVSGGLEQIDFDVQCAKVFPKWQALVAKQAPGLLERLSIVRTPRKPTGGRHVRYRCPDVEIPSSTKLAIDPKLPGKERTLIETRGEGGYAIAPGSPCACHETGNPYIIKSGPEIPPVISVEEREVLLSCARYLSREDAIEGSSEAPPAGSRASPEHSGRPGDDFDRNGPPWIEILRKHGWKRAGKLTTGEVRWRRPGKIIGWSATTGHCRDREAGVDLFRVFSSNAYPFEEGKAYGKFRAYALLDHEGDLSAAARELRKLGYGENGQAQNDDDEETDATVADLIEAGVTATWVWQFWISTAELVVIASDPGIGKTRMCADWARRIYYGLSWPDGTPATFPQGSKTLWVAADCQYRELTKLSEEFKIPPEAMVLNASKNNPYGGTMLDSQEDLDKFERRIERVKPALVFIDTTLRATDKTAHKPEDAKAFFTPIAEIAQRTGTAIVCVTHLNVDGKPLGRRIVGVGRVVILLEWPDHKQLYQRRLYVEKSHSMYPDALTVTMGDAGNEYAVAAPRAKSGGKSGGGSADLKDSGADEANAKDKAVAWLKQRFAKSNSPSDALKVHELRTASEKAKISSKTLYAAKRQLEKDGLLEELTDSGKKCWRLVDAENTDV